MKYISLIVLLMLPLLIVEGAIPSPQPPQNTIDEFNKNYDRYEQELQEQQRLLKQKTIEKEPNKIEVNDEKQHRKSNLGRIEGVNCFELDEIKIEGADELPAKEKINIQNKYLKKCMTSVEINSILEEITNWYVKKGFITTRVYIPEQNILYGKLIVTVVEGKIQAVKQNDNSLGDKLEVFAAFPIPNDRKLNIRDMEQGLDQLNKVPSNNAQTKIVPGDEIGTSIIEVDNEQSDKFRGYFEINNSLNSNGAPKMNLRAEKDNLFHIDDQFQYTYGTGVEKTANEDINRNHALYLTFPVEYLTFRPSYSYYRSLTNLDIGGVKYPYESFTNNINTYVDYVIYRWKTSILTLGAGLVYKDRRTYFADELLYTLSRRTTNMEYSIDYTDRFSSGFYDLKFSVVQGTTLFGSEDNDSVQPGSAYPKPQFVKYLFDYSVCKYFENGLKFCSNGKLQVSNSTLYSEEQIGIGDRYTVRGFNKGFFLGDDGFYFRNELALPFYYEGNNNFVRAVWSPEIFIGLDLGYASKKGGSALYGNQNDAFISGFCLGVRNNAKWFNLSLTAGVPIAQPRFIWELEHNNLELYANLTVKVF